MTAGPMTRRWTTKAARRLAAAALVLVAGCGGGDTAPSGGVTAPGADRTATTAALESGAEVLQATEPVDQVAMYLVGFHPSKTDPSLQMESHHYCDQVNEDFAQCVLYDGNTAAARLHGLEFIISARLYDTLPDEERPYWHPHNYEILSGQLRMPGLPQPAEHAALARKVNSYGKTWHVWKTGVYGSDGDPLPFGPPHLAWSFNRDGEADAGMVAARDARMGLDTADARNDRAGLAAEAHPQTGVRVLADRFPDASGTPPGVVDDGTTRAVGVPTFTMRPR